MSESFVHYFIEAQGPDYDQEQLLFTARDLAGAGLETTATTIRWAIVLLANHSSVQERLHADIDSVVGSHRLPTLDDRSRSVPHRGIFGFVWLLLYRPTDTLQPPRWPLERVFSNISVNS